MLYLASLAVFTFGALSFSILAISYWTQKRRKGTVLPLFTLICAAAFLLNLAFQAGAPMLTGLIVARDIAVGLLAPLMLHLVYELEAAILPARRVWQAILAVLYAAALASAIIPGDWADRAPAAILLAASAAGLSICFAAHRRGSATDRAHALWLAAILLLLFLCAASNLVQPGPATTAAPDYLLLAFFGASLYYRERLVFFDLLVKRGAFFLLGLIILALSVTAASRVLFRLPEDWSPWICALLLLPFWLLGPWIYTRVNRAIDRIWLRRPFSPPEAEREFIHSIQGAASEDDLRLRSAKSLAAIFQAPSAVRFDAPLPASFERHLGEALTPQGYILLSPRANGVPFLSGDRQLLQSLARTLAVVLENVRFRAGEQELRWLASRAELKALRAQINPHFLFNALNTIAGLIHEQPQLADETIEQLAQVFRYTLRKSGNEWVSLAEEVEFVTAYLRVEQARYGARLQVMFDLDPSVASVPVPAMCIQPLVENAIRHGVAAIEAAGAVVVRTAHEDGAVRIEIRDNGPGFPPGFSLDAAADAHGLRNVADRLRGYYGPSARLCWENGSGGTRVWFHVLPGNTRCAS